MVWYEDELPEGHLTILRRSDTVSPIPLTEKGGWMLEMAVLIGALIVYGVYFKGKG